MRIIFALIVASTMFISASSVNAEQICVPRDKAVEQLGKQFEERMSGRGLAANGERMIELFVSKKGSWTVLASEPSGLSCIMASGESWQGIKVPVGDPV